MCLVPFSHGLRWVEGILPFTPDRTDQCHPGPVRPTDLRRCSLEGTNERQATDRVDPHMTPTSSTEPNRSPLFGGLGKARIQVSIGDRTIQSVLEWCRCMTPRIRWRARGQGFGVDSFAGVRVVSTTPYLCCFGALRIRTTSQRVPE